MSSASKIGKVLDRNRQPWVSSPYSLISWWDMQKFSAAQFYEFGSRIGAGRRQFELMEKDKVVPKAEWKLNPGYKLLKIVKKQCESIDLRVSALCVGEFLRNVDVTGSVSSKQLSKVLSEVENTIRREMSCVQFFYMPSEQTDFYSQNELFGAQVNAKFPSIQYDMEEAGNSFAMGRGTACVFHLMRIMEVGVREFGKKLGVSLVNEKNWQNILDELNKAIKILSPKAAGTVEMSQASANLYAVKLGWRNEVMHPKDTYTLEEAKNLIGQVKLFMGQLATII
jgi:hypothetical protein